MKTFKVWKISLLGLLVGAGLVLADSFEGGRVAAALGGGFTGGSGTDNRVAVWNGTTALDAGLLSDDATNVNLTSGAFSIGTDPADSGTFRLENGATLVWEASPTGTDLTAITVTAAEHLNLNGVQVNFLVNLTAEWTLGATAFSPFATDANDIGVDGTAVQDIFINRTINIEGATNDTSEYVFSTDDPALDANVSPVRQFSATYDPGTLAAGAARCDDVTVTGIVITRPVVANPGAVDPAVGCVVSTVRASATNTVRVCWQNIFDATTACDTATSTWAFKQAAGPS